MHFPTQKGFGGQEIEIEEKLLLMIANFANGDARTALNTLEMVVLNGERQGERTIVTEEILEQCISKKSLLYDKNGEEHYNLISALHKSMRNSDPDAAVYWLARMLEAGRPALYRPAARALCQRGYWAGGYQRASPGSGGIPGVPFYRDAGMQRKFDGGGNLSFGNS